MSRVERLLARKAALSPGLVMAAPRRPFPWYTVPYVHGMMPPHGVFADGAITTDDLGFRHVEIEGRKIGWRAFQQLPGRKGLLLGASTAFSMGASSDGATIASVLSRRTGRRWFSLATASHVSTQEVILYGLVDARGIDHIVVLSGLNTLSAAMLASPYEGRDVFTPNFFAIPHRRASTTQALVRFLAQRARRWLRAPARAEHSAAPAAEALALALAAMRRDLGSLHALAAARGARVTFLLQPLLPLIDKPLSPEEREVLEIQRTLGGDPEFLLWGAYLTLLPPLYQPYTEGLAAICRDLGIAYRDLNEPPSAFAGGDWLFCDAAHFTDRGCEVCAETIGALA